MVTDELRKKWGTIFMGDREASLEQIDAMQEPIFRERNRKEQEQNYLDRVKQRATDRAKAILGEAYAERQKILEEARAEAASAHDKLLDQAKQIQLQAQEELNLANQEVAKAREIRQDAELIREQAHEEGYQAGIAQANEELKVFRGEMGQGFATILQLVESQIGSITESWREELVLLVQTAITAATGWVLDNKHEAIMRTLVVEAVSLLEQRETITVRVNPQDEALVGDMFKAAKEKAPEIKQWIVTADENIECGGLIAESGSGSVDCRREHFKELVEGILVHLALPEGEADIARAMKIGEAVCEQAQRFIPQPEEQTQEIPVESENVDSGTDEPVGAVEENPSPMSDPVNEDTVPPESFAENAEDNELPPVFEEDQLEPEQEFVETSETDALQDLNTGDEIPASVEDVAMQGEEQEPVPEAWLPPLGEEEGANDSIAIDTPPSLSELEDELFPLEDGTVLAQGGFLSGDNGQAG